MATTAPARDANVEQEALAWMNDPYEHFGHHNTKIHSLDRKHVEAVQLAAMQLRFEERMEQVQMLKMLADGQGITRIALVNVMRHQQRGEVIEAVDPGDALAISQFLEHQHLFHPLGKA